jgi:hypothetical protein
MDPWNFSPLGTWTVKNDFGGAIVVDDASARQEIPSLQRLHR